MRVDQTRLRRCDRDRAAEVALRRRNRCCGCFGRIGNTKLFRFGCFGRIGGARLFRLYRDAQFPIWSVISVAIGLGLSKRNIVIATLQLQTHHRQHDHMLARSSTPRLFRLARLFRLLPIRMIATEVPRGRCSARSACVAGVARDLEQIGIYVEAQLAAGRQISQALAAQADVPTVGCIILQLRTCTRKSWAT